jgi:hypothetical protein
MAVTLKIVIKRGTTPHNIFENRDGVKERRGGLDFFRVGLTAGYKKSPQVE